MKPKTYTIPSPGCDTLNDDGARIAITTERAEVIVIDAYGRSTPVSALQVVLALKKLMEPVLPTFKPGDIVQPNWSNDQFVVVDQYADRIARKEWNTIGPREIVAINLRTGAYHSFSPVGVKVIVYQLPHVV